MSQTRWIKSSYTSANGNCVELTTTLDAIRDSKDPHGPVLRVDATRFINAIKSGHYDQ